MEKKSNSCPVEEFFKSFRPSRGNRPNPSSPSASKNPNIVKSHHHHTPKYPKPNIVASEVVSVEFDYSTPQKNGGKLASVAPNKNNMEAVSQFVPAKKIANKATRMESNNNKMNANMEEDEFTKYIKRAWNQIRTPSNVNVNASATATATGGEDTGKDHFSDYINRAKKRMLRNMSSFVGGRNDSMK